MLSKTWRLKNFTLAKLLQGSGSKSPGQSSLKNFRLTTTSQKPSTLLQWSLWEPGENLLLDEKKRFAHDARCIFVSDLCLDLDINSSLLLNQINYPRISKIFRQYIQYFPQLYGIFLSLLSNQINCPRFFTLFGQNMLYSLKSFIF